MTSTTSVAAGRYAEVVRRLHGELVQAGGVDLPMRLWDGTTVGAAGVGYELLLLRPSGLRAMLLPPSDLTAGEAYLRGEIDVVGDLVGAMHAASEIALSLDRKGRVRLARSLLALPPPEGGRPPRARLRGRRHGLERDRMAIAHHYDLPQGFYEQFLDSRLVYSCAYFTHAGESVEAAQQRKLDLICRKLRLRPGQRLLDIGCGFGALLQHAAEQYGVRAVGVTLSRTQAEAGRERIAAAGLSDRVEIRLADYRELDERFDAVASVGMIEHVGPGHVPAFCTRASHLTEDGGLFLLHGIVMGDPGRVKTGRERSFVSAHVFPDGGLVPAWRLVRDVERAGFALLDVEQLRPHYALTLRQWVARLEANREAAVAAASEHSYRTWRLYMAGSALSFEVGELGVVQVLGVRGRSPQGSLPLGRSWMLPPVM